MSRKYKAAVKKPIRGHAAASTATRVEVYLGLPTELFHTLHDDWKKMPDGYPFARYLVSLIEKGLVAK